MPCSHVFAKAAARACDDDVDAKIRKITVRVGAVFPPRHRRDDAPPRTYPNKHKMENNSSVRETGYGKIASPLARILVDLLDLGPFVGRLLGGRATHAAHVWHTAWHSSGPVKKNR